MSLTIHEGQIRIRIVRNPTRVGERLLPRWEFRWRDAAGRRRRLKRARLTDAKREARRIAQDLAAGRSAELSAADVASFRAARLHVVKIGMTLEAATAELAEVHRRLEGTDITPIEAADFARRHHAAGASDKPLSEVVDELLAARKKAGVSDRHYDDLKSRLRRFAADVQCAIGDLNAPVMNDWLSNLDCTSRTRLNYRRALSNLVGYAIGRKYLPDTFADMRHVDRPDPDDDEIEIFRVEEMRLLLRHVTDSVLPALLLGGFAGLRTSEIPKLAWSDIHWSQGLITVPRKTKTGPRLVPLMDNLRAWLEPLAGEGPILRVVHSTIISGQMRAVAAANRELERDHSTWRLKWKHNALRHSFVSYWASFEHDLHMISERTGHSVATLKKDYQRPDIFPKDGRAWFAIYPEARGVPQQLSLFDHRTQGQGRAGEAVVQTSAQNPAAVAGHQLTPPATVADAKSCPPFAP